MARRSPYPKQPRYGLVVVGASLGGLKALQTVFGRLPANFPLPIAAVLHRYKTATDALTGLLQRSSDLKVIEVESGEPVAPGRIFIAPADYHLLVQDGGFVLSVDETVNYSRPSIDLLFESAADAFGDRVIGVLLTGANQDGAAGIRKIKDRGGAAVIQDPSTAEAPTMPEAAIAATKVDRILPLEDIAVYLGQCAMERR